MFLFENSQYLLIQLMLYQLNVYFVQTTWSSSNVSTIKLLGLFQHDINSSNSTLETIQSLALFKAAVVLSQRYNITIDGQLIEWYIEETTRGKILDSLRSMCDYILTSNVVGIIGPRRSQEAHTIAAFTETIGIPVVSYAATDPNLSSRRDYPTFYRTIPSDRSAALSIVKLFMRFNWTTCLIIYQNDAYGYGGMSLISEIFMQNNLTVKEKIEFDIATHSFQGDLKNDLFNSGVRIVLLWAVSNLTPIILQQALDHDLLGPKFLWIFSSSPSLDNFHKKSSDKLVGMLTVEPVTGSSINMSINRSLLNAAYEVWQQYESDSFPGENNVHPYALFTFDAAWLLIQSLDQLCSTITRKMFRSCISFVNSSSCFNRQLINANEYHKQIISTTFVGVTGPIEFRMNQTDRSKGFYYLVQNIQPSTKGVMFVPVLKYSENNLWQTYKEPSIIVWPNNSFMVPRDHAILSGSTIRIGIIKSAPFVMAENIKDEFGYDQTKFLGYVPDLIELLEKKMHFIPNITSTPSNTSYTNHIYAVINGDYDILIGDVTITSQRRELVSFTTSIFDNSLSVVIKKQTSVHVDLFSYLNPFTSKLWIAILAATIYTSVLICLIERRSNAALRDRSLASASAMSVWYSIGTIMGYGVDFHMTTASGRLLTIALYMLSLILVATYTATLAWSLTKAGTRYIITGIQDIKKGRLLANRIGIIEKTAMETYYLREISQNIRNYYPGTGRQPILDRLLDDTIDATILDSGVAEYITNNIYCNLTVIGETFNVGAFGIVMRKNWPYQQDLDMNILALRESGDLDKLRTKWFQTGKCDGLGETLNAMRIESMAGLFLIFGIITILALLPLLWSKRCKIKIIYTYGRNQSL